jgi:Zn-dependent M28 family amino/carboxypeptidase
MAESLYIALDQSQMPMAHDRLDSSRSTGWRGLYASASAVVVVIASTMLQAGSETASAGTSFMEDVSGKRIMGTIGDLQAFGSRALHLDSASETATYIFDEFSSLGLQTEYQEFTTLNYTSTNVVAQLQGPSEGSGFLLVGAHYDSVNSDANDYASSLSAEAPGADDDASGIAAMLEIAYVLADSNPKIGIKFAAFGAEERTYDNLGGIAGSRAFVAAESQDDVNYVGGMVLDMIGFQGTSDQHTVLITNSNADTIPQAFVDAVTDHELDLEIEVVVDPTINFSDHFSFWEAGYPCTLAFESSPQGDQYQFNPYYHTSEDLVSHLSEGQMENVTKATLGALMTLSGLDESNSPSTTVLLLIVLAASVVAIIVLLMFRMRDGKR